MNVLIVEDEKLAAERLIQMIQKVELDIDVLAVISSVKETISWLKKHKADLIFLDIQLSDGLSFSIFEEIEPQIPVIFTTAYEEYAIQAFRVNSIDYLLKPIAQEDLNRALDKFSKTRIQAPDLKVITQLIQDNQHTYKNNIIVQAADVVHRIKTDNIAYFFAEHRYVYMKTFDKQSFIVNYTLDGLMEILNPKTFFRINRKIIIHTEAIKKMVTYSRSRIKIYCYPPIPDKIESIVSLERMPEFRKWLDR